MIEETEVAVKPLLRGLDPDAASMVNREFDTNFLNKI